MKKCIVNILVAMSMGLVYSTPSSAGQWSEYASCDSQYSQDVAACNAVSTAANRAKCFASAADRLGKCNSTKGATTGVPVLFKG